MTLQISMIYTGVRIIKENKQEEAQQLIWYVE